MFQTVTHLCYCIKEGQSSMYDLQEVRLVCQWDGFSQRNIKGVGWDAAQEGHRVRATEERMVLTRFSWDWVLVFVLQC